LQAKDWSKVCELQALLRPSRAKFQSYIRVRTKQLISAISAEAICRDSEGEGEDGEGADAAILDIAALDDFDGADEGSIFRRDGGGDGSDLY